MTASSRRSERGQVESVLDLLELTEFAWHDCYDEIAPSDDVVDDLLVCSRGDLAGLVRAARLAVTDRRDLRLWVQWRTTRDSPPRLENQR